ncbi:MAG: PCMD domain-containing protein [Muribaculaceae bacterium]|nr:PCMD domain-containing protein [Muribaculaceae bacterium]
MKKILLATVAAVAMLPAARAQKFELLPFGDMDRWQTREIKESFLLGGNTRNIYEIAPEKTVKGDIPYEPTGGSPWATSNVLAKVKGIVKTSNAVWPDPRSGRTRAAKLETIIERCKAVGIINIDVLVGGSIFLGEMIEPVSSTSDPYSHMVMGIPFTKRPKTLRFDYRLEMPKEDSRIYSSGFGRKKTLPGRDNAEVFIILQRRWEDADGNIYAKRVGTGRERFGKSTKGWVNGHEIAVQYGDITKAPGYQPYMGLIPEADSYYARNSRGKMVPVKEVGWDSPDATPTHMLVMASAASGKAYIGTPGLTLWIDNVGLTY